MSLVAFASSDWIALAALAVAVLSALISVPLAFRADKRAGRAERRDERAETRQQRAELVVSAAGSGPEPSGARRHGFYVRNVGEAMARDVYVYVVDASDATRSSVEPEGGLTLAPGEQSEKCGVTVWPPFGTDMRFKVRWRDGGGPHDEPTEIAPG